MKRVMVNYHVEILRRRICTEQMTPASALALLTDAHTRRDIDDDEFRDLLDTPLPDLLVNARGGDA